jgi:S-formylglutathione hydrolase FrmB
MRTIAKSRSCILAAIWTILLVLTAFGQSQPVRTKDVASVRTFSLKSKLMARDMPYRVVLPPDYNNSNESRSYPVIYLLHGLSGHYDNWTDKTKLAEYSTKYSFIIVTPESGDGWYTDSVSVPDDKYESYIVQELIPQVEKDLRTIPDRDHRFIAGLSMGGYGAIKFGLKYPEKFSLVGSFSGALGAATVSAKDFGPNSAITKTILSIFGIENSETRKQNDIFAMARDMSAGAIKAAPFIYMSCGTEDFLFANNRQFADVLDQKKIPHEYRELPGAHTWAFWDGQVQEFLRIADARLGNSKK